MRYGAAGGRPVVAATAAAKSDVPGKGAMGSTQVDILPIINRLTFFDTFTTEEKRQIVSDEAHFRVYDPGELLIRKGSADQSLFILLTGSVNVTEASGETILATLTAGDIFGEMAFLTDTRRTAHVTAREPVIAIKLDRVMFERLSIHVREKFKDKIIAKLVARLDLSNRQRVRQRAAEAVPVAPSEPAFVTGRELIRKIIAGTASLPAMPEVMLKVQQMIKRPATSPAELARVIETDAAMVASILKVANSAYYGFRGKVSTIQHASALFGTRRLAELITALSAGGVLGKALDGYGLKAGDMWRHSIAVAVTAGEIAGQLNADSPESAYMAGLLHDVGKIILNPYVRERQPLFEKYRASYPEKTIQDAERDILGFDHAVIAAILCENWNLPRGIAFSIRNHHQPSAAGNHLLSHVVHLADYYASEIDLARSAAPRGRFLDDASLAVVPVDDEMLRVLTEKSCLYVESLTGRLSDA